MLTFTRIDVLRGKVNGFLHPGVRVHVSPVSEPGILDKRLEALHAALEATVSVETGARFKSALAQRRAGQPAWFTLLADGLIINAGLPPLDHQVLPAAPGSGETVVLCETLFPDYYVACLNFLQRTLNTAPRGEKHTVQALNALQRGAPTTGKTGTNTRHLLQAAHRLGIPACHLPGDRVGFGMGSRSLTLSSSISGQTPEHGVRLARNKAVTRELLAMAQLPATQQRVATSPAEALRAAGALGWPVVAKPRGLDGGQAITTHIVNAAQLDAAVTKILALGQAALIEAQAPGDEYRLLYIHDQLICIHQRVPAHVIGDGRQCVEQLVTTENERRAQLPATGFSNRPLLLKEDADAMLAAQGLTPRSTPAAGQVVRLATVPKVATGGAVVPVAAAEFHPDILSASAKAVKLLGLDIAGVDYITTDHTRSWRETGGVITEVNAQPQINRFEAVDIHQQVMQTLLDGEARVPSIILITDEHSAAADAVHQVLQGCSAHLAQLGLITAGVTVAPAIADQFACAAAAAHHGVVLANRSVTAIITVASLHQILQHGFPLDQHDLVAVVALDPASAAVGQLAEPLYRPHLRGAAAFARGTTPHAALSQCADPLAVTFYDDAEALAAMLIQVATGQR